MQCTRLFIRLLSHGHKVWRRSAPIVLQLRSDTSMMEGMASDIQHDMINRIIMTENPMQEPKDSVVFRMRVTYAAVET